jgi:ABC-type glycerol-3-phosphate transport system substrate-binding protein
VGVVPLPVIGEQRERRLYLFSRGFAVSAATQQPQIAWRLLEFLSRQPGFDEDAMPARASVRQATAFWDGIEPIVASLVEDYLDHSFALPYAAMRQALGQAIATTLLTDTELLVALAEAEMAVAQGLVREDEPLTAVIRRTNAGTVTGSILFVTGGFHYDRHLALARAFEAENPDIQIDVQPPATAIVFGLPFQDMDRARGGQQADCFLYGPLTTEAEIARVLPLDAMLELEPDLSRDDFYPLALNAFIYDGSLIALPEQFRLPLIGYDTTLFDAAGVPYPEIGWTLQSFLETAVALTNEAGRQKQYGYVPRSAAFVDAWLFLHAFGPNLLDHSVAPATANLNTPTVAEALRWFVALSETYGIIPVYRTNRYDYAGFVAGIEHIGDRSAIFATRRGAMWWDDGSESEGAYAAPTAAIEERLYTTFPLAEAADVVLPAEITAFYISAETEQRQACWQWFIFLMERDTGLGVPARRSIAHSEEFRLRAGPAAGTMLQNAAQMSQRQFAQPPDWMNLSGWYSIALTRVLNENITPEEALALTQAEFETYRQCVLDRELFAATAQVRRIRECADPASPYVILAEE